MALQFSAAVREARANAIETAIGTSAVMKIRSGSVPSLVSDADAGTVLATLTLPADWMAAASTASNVTTKANSGTWEDASADATGTAGHFRIYASDGTTCHMQGTCGIGTGDLQLNNTSLATGQTVTITAFTLTEANG